MTVSGIADCCCARATTGHATAPPSPAINVRRRITGCLSSRESYSTILRDALCITENSDCQCPLWVISGHCRRTSECPLYPLKAGIAKHVPAGKIGPPPPAQRIGVASSQRWQGDHADFAGVACRRLRSSSRGITDETSPPQIPACGRGRCRRSRGLRGRRPIRRARSL